MLFNLLSIVFSLIESMNIYLTFPYRAASLRAGNLHPDAVVHLEQCLRAEKSTYYLELHRYHNEYGHISAVNKMWCCRITSTM